MTEKKKEGGGGGGRGSRVAGTLAEKERQSAEQRHVDDRERRRVSDEERCWRTGT